MRTEIKTEMRPEIVNQLQYSFDELYGNNENLFEK
jgi:hypothetical protein